MGERAHVASTDCWCGPTVESYGDRTSGPGFGEAPPMDAQRLAALRAISWPERLCPRPTTCIDPDCALPALLAEVRRLRGALKDIAHAAGKAGNIGPITAFEYCEGRAHEALGLTCCGEDD